MFSNIGNKIKGLAVFLCFIGIFSSLLAGGYIIYCAFSSRLPNLLQSLSQYLSQYLPYLASDEAANLTLYYFSTFLVNAIGNKPELSLMITGLLVIVIGSILSWLGSLVLYGFGQLVDNSDIIRKQLSNKTR